ncbi:MAG: VWA domain-containing protein, partial [Planctomycetales bacterium]|nr:VWA domain-containing protein [Planctomycetales bacterium]
LVRSQTVVKGMTGVGTAGTDGAVDRITYEILRAMEERPTLVVWFFDQSGSLQKRRQEIRDRFERIYQELGIVTQADENRETKRFSDAPLLTSVFAFGQQVQLLTAKPTDDLAEIQAAIDGIQQDDSGIERVFSALYKGVEKFKSYRNSRTGRGSERNVLFIVVSDERGDDTQGLDATLKECQKYAIPVYVIGVPAPFGRDMTYVKYIDPDPQFDQSPQWAQVDQGPESILPERVRLGFRDEYYSEPVIDSGFGPYALSRLAYETGGIYFTVHPNRRLGGRVRRGEIQPFASNLEYFVDPEVMVKYRPDYVSSSEYTQRVKESPLRQTLVRAAQLPRVDTLQSPTLRFVKRDEASLANALTRAQQQSARLEPQLAQLAELLRQGADYRDREISPRWIAGFDLALGTVLAHKVRAEGYNAMLAKAKRGMNFEKPASNTWVLKP